MKIDFAALNDRALDNLSSVLEEFLALETKGVSGGNEIQMLNPLRCDDEFGSFSINTETGFWGDFAEDEDAKGGDVTSLVSYVKELDSQVKAAGQLTKFLNDLDKATGADRGSQMKANATSRIEIGGTVAQPIQIEPDSRDASPFQRSATSQNTSPAKPGEAIPELNPCLAQFGPPTHVFPYRDADGHYLAAVCRYESAAGKEFRQFTLRRRADDSRLVWDPHAPDVPRPLYGLDQLAARPDAWVFFCEGEKAADACGQMLPEVVAVTTPGGAGSPHKSNLSPLEGRTVIIWPDADDAGGKYAMKVFQLLKGANSSTRVRIMSPITVKPSVDADGSPTLEPGFQAPKGWDPADAYAEGWTAPHVEMLLRMEGTSFRPSTETALAIPTTTVHSQAPELDIYPAGFTRRSDGVYYVKQSRDGDVLVWLSSFIRVVALARSIASENWCTVLEFEDRDGVTHSWTLQNSMFGTELSQICANLLGLGARVTSNVGDRQYLSRYLQECQPAQRWLCVSRPGWNDNGEVNGKCFVLPDGTVFGEGNQRVVIETRDPTAGDAFKALGSLDGWKTTVGALCAENSRMIVSVCAALSSPMLTPLGLDSGGIHFRGPSSIGKTTTLFIATSVWGNPQRLIITWRATANGLEAVAAQHNDLLLALDEMSQVEPKEAGATAYMLSNNKGKARASQYGGAKSVAEWALMVLSTGEVSLADHLLSGGINVKAGQEARFIDVIADAGAGHGLFENLHGEAGGAELSLRLKSAASANFGTPGRAFVEVLADPTRSKAVLEGIKANIVAFEQLYVPDDAAGQARRVGHRFGFFAAVGEACIELGILPWESGQAMWGASQCFASWLGGRGGSGNLEVDQAIRQVRHHLETYGNANYQSLDELTFNSTQPFRAQLYGYRRSTSDGRTEYLILADAFQDVVCRGLDGKAVLQTLKASNYLELGRDGKLQQQVRIPGLGRVRFYVISADLLGDPEPAPVVAVPPTPTQPRTSPLAKNYKV